MIIRYDPDSDTYVTANRGAPAAERVLEVDTPVRRLLVTSSTREGYAPFDRRTKIGRLVQSRLPEDIRCLSLFPEGEDFEAPRAEPYALRILWGFPTATHIFCDGPDVAAAFRIPLNGDADYSWISHSPNPGMKKRMFQVIYNLEEWIERTL